MNDKKKVKKRPSQRLGFFNSLWWLILIPICAVIIGIGVVGYSYIFNGQIRQTSLPENLRPTAAALPIVDFRSDPVQLLALNNEFFLVQSQMLTDSMEIWDNLCVQGTLTSDANYLQHSRFWVNGQQVYGLTPSSRRGNPNTFNSYRHCVSGDLESGLHLVEFHLRDSAWGDPIAVQQWAIEVE